LAPRHAHALSDAGFAKELQRERCDDLSLFIKAL
jgi:hypothetical protein